MMERVIKSQAVAMSIAGSDCSAGAGLQADLKTMSALDVYGLTVVTSVVSEIPGLVSKIVHLDADIVYDQTSILLKAFPVRAVKTGMIGTLQQAQAIVQSLVESKMNSLHLVVDPVIVATAGSRLMKNDALDFLKAELYPKATLITPNMDEASVLLNSEKPIQDLQSLEDAAFKLSDIFQTSILLKGGHLKGDLSAYDVAVINGKSHFYESERIANIKTHGTGCTLSAAITAFLARNYSLNDAIANAKKWVHHCIMYSYQWNKNNQWIDALNHSVCQNINHL